MLIKPDEPPMQSSKMQENSTLATVLTSMKGNEAAKKGSRAASFLSQRNVSKLLYGSQGPGGTSF